MRTYLYSCFLLLVVLTGCSTAPTTEPTTTNLPSAETWLAHVNQDLAPYWLMPSAHGDPVGNFPTFRCHDGSVYNPDDECAEFEFTDGWIRHNLGRQYVRMQSRQTFAYGVIYHLTGNLDALKLMQAGVNHLRTHALDAQNGGAHTYWRDGESGVEPQQRTSQDLAYTQLGLAMYYYLTRDPEILKDIVQLKDYIFENYYREDIGMLAWTLDSDKQELVAQLDQINAYMLLLLPVLPEPFKSDWTNDVIQLSDTMINQFFNADESRFYGYIHDESGLELGSRHADFGHSAKTFWMLYLTGKQIDRQDYIDIAKQHLPTLLNAAYITQAGDSFWGSKLNKDGSVNNYRSWWQYAELNQASATLALIDNSSAHQQRLIETYDYWFNHFVDKEHGEVWTGISDDYTSDSAKAHHWKNGFHSLEHALVGYITSQALLGKQTTLHFAPIDTTESNWPAYVFNGTVADTEIATEPTLGITPVKVTYSNIE